MVGRIDDDVHYGDGRGQQHGVNDMDHAVVGLDVGDGDLGVVDEDTVGVDGHGDVLAVERGDDLPVGEVSRKDLSAGDVVGQDVGQGALGVCQ